MSEQSPPPYDGPPPTFHQPADGGGRESLPGCLIGAIVIFVVFAIFVVLIVLGIGGGDEVDEELSLAVRHVLLASEMLPAR